MLSRCCCFFYNFSSSFFIIFPIFFVVFRRLLVLRLRFLPLSFLIFVPPLPPRGWNSESRNWIRNESGEGVEGASCCRRRPSGGVLLGGVRERKLAWGDSRRNVCCLRLFTPSASCPRESGRHWGDRDRLCLNRGVGRGAGGKGGKNRSSRLGEILRGVESGGEKIP